MLAMQYLLSSIPALLVLLIGSLSSCASGVDADTLAEAERMELEDTITLSFEMRQIVDSAHYWWALTHGDMNNDGMEDVVFIDGNADASGYLGYKQAQSEAGIWQDVVIAKSPPTGGGFAAGDLETGDMDGDGDVDVLAVKHPGEWTDASANAELYWYENPGTTNTANKEPSDRWRHHAIGMAKGAVKDMNIGDFNGDGLADLAVMTFDEENVRVHRQNADGTFSQVADLTRTGIHEGMDVGDLDGDGDVDVAANGYLFLSPGGNLEGEWIVESLDERWHNQTVHKDTWSLNATKTFVTDLEGDGTHEIVMSHSENAGYPIMLYRRGTNGAWTGQTLLDSLPAAHTLMVYDMDLDGDKDVVTGVNRGRAVSLERGLSGDRDEDFPILILINQGDNDTFVRQAIAGGGIYNGRVTDYDKDGDYDIFRYPDHESRELYIMINQVR